MKFALLAVSFAVLLMSCFQPAMAFDKCFVISGLKYEDDTIFAPFRLMHKETLTKGTLGKAQCEVVPGGWAELAEKMRAMPGDQKQQILSSQFMTVR